MASWSADRRAARLGAFRFALTVLAVVVTLGLLGSWQGLNQANRLIPEEPRVSPIWIVGLLGLCAVQVVVLWWSRIDLSWWEPIVIEAGLFMVFAILAHQVAGTHMTSCTATPSGPEACTTIQPAIIHGSWIGAFAVIGVVIGVLWSLSSRPSRHSRPEPAPEQT